MAERVAVVTGAAGRMGRLLVAALTERGYVVIGLDRSSAIHPEDRLCRACDITDEARVHATFEEIGAQHGRIDLLVLAAGLSAIGAFVDHDLDVHRRVMDATHFGAVACVLAAHPLLHNASGRVVLIGSVAGFAPVLGRPAYVAAKHAVTGLLEAVRPELAADGIRVTIVHPTFVVGGMSEAAPRHPGRPRSVSGGELSSADVVRAALSGIDRGVERVFVGRTARAAWLLSRHTPRLYRRIMVRRLRAGTKGH